jgi:hypothetical protein
VLKMAEEMATAATLCVGSNLSHFIQVSDQIS